ncbi:MAG: SAM-dependent methyltransferase, partial [Gammaproteobacteria bacterium]|nr:SAM-dependent methyltransferase [Gammaproteobacteria bacterium]MBM2829553.1 SAM-dependent methyltransferase [Gammaproteobacteria bacterium]
KKLLRNRTDIFPEYNQDNFEHVFSEYFNTLGKKQIPGTERIVYLMQTPRA